MADYSKEQDSLKKMYANKKKKKGGLDPSDMPQKPKDKVQPPEEQIDPRTKRIKVIEIKPDITIKNTGSTEGMRDAAKKKGKPHSSPEGRYKSRMRSLPLKVVTFKNGGKVRLAKRGGGRAYGQNS